jgi:hypothetical protein
MAERVRVRWRWRIRIRIRRRSGNSGSPSPSGGGRNAARTFLLATSLAMIVVVAGPPAARSALGSGESVTSTSGTARSQSENNPKAAVIQAGLAGQKFRIVSHSVDNTGPCENHSYGKVQEFFQKNQCVSLRRELYILADDRGGVRVLLAVAHVGMRDADQARCLQGLLDKNGSGNITELSRERGPYKSVRYDGAVFTSGRDQAIVANAQAKSIQGVPREADLKVMADYAIR